MPVLKNAKHEAFARALAEGKKLNEAYPAAGYRVHPGNAHRLSKKDDVAARVVELKKAIARKMVLSRADILRELADNARLAKDAGQYAASNQALVQYGKEIGMFVERRLVGIGAVNDMNEKELLDVLGREPTPAEFAAASARLSNRAVGHA